MNDPVTRDLFPTLHTVFVCVSGLEKT